VKSIQRKSTQSAAGAETPAARVDFRADRKHRGSRFRHAAGVARPLTGSSRKVSREAQRMFGRRPQSVSGQTVCIDGLALLYEPQREPRFILSPSCDRCGSADPTRFPYVESVVLGVVVRAQANKMCRDCRFDVAARLGPPADPPPPPRPRADDTTNAAPPAGTGERTSRTRGPRESLAGLWLRRSARSFHVG
jgi:hypothetical protein